MKTNAVFTPSEPLIQFKCGDHNRFQEMGSSSTAMYCPVIQDKDGKILEFNDHNIHTTTYKCLECGKIWERRRCGKDVTFSEVTNAL